MKRIKTILSCQVLFMLLSGVSAADEWDDRAEKGPFEQRPSFRKVGPPVLTQTQMEVAPEPSVGLLVDEGGAGETNELVVMLNYANAEKIAELLSLSSRERVGTAPAALERAFVAAVRSEDRNVGLVLHGAVHARFLASRYRMSDEARGAAEDSLRESMQRYIVLRYPSVAKAREAKKYYERDNSVFAHVTINQKAVLHWAPNDPYFSNPGPAAGDITPRYQWGLHAMKFPQAWEQVRGHAQIGVLEGGFPGYRTFVDTSKPNEITPHPELARNYRKQFVLSEISSYNVGPFAFNANHAMHVAGIIAAESNNGNNALPANSAGRVTGGCINCSITPLAYMEGSDSIALEILNAIDAGMQIINWSGSLTETWLSNTPPFPPFTCPSYSPPQAVNMCNALFEARRHDILIVQSTGNFMKNESELLAPLLMASDYPILPVGGVQALNNSGASAYYARWIYDSSNGSNVATMNGVVAPAKSIPSTIWPDAIHEAALFAMCGDAPGVDESAARYWNGYGDGVGSCTGTSMAAPHVSALAGLIRSINPRLSAFQVRQIIQQSGDAANMPSVQWGYGLPNAEVAVNLAIATNPSRLTPLFSLYSSARSDSFYTTVPQMATAALKGTLMPHGEGDKSAQTYISAYGNPINGYSFPKPPVAVIGPSQAQSPLAEVWVFTTHVNPKNAAVPLEPLYRMSWKCNDSLRSVAICNGPQPKHIDTMLVNQSEVNYFQWEGYQVDGLEGYVYPKTLPQPAGTVKLMRKFHPGRDDHAVFPLTALPAMQSQGYTVTTNGNDWLGYVYPNNNYGRTPVIQ